MINQTCAELEKEGAAVMASDIQYIKRDLAEIKSKLDLQYVTQMEFRPIKQIVYGLVSMIMTGVIVALLTLVIGRGV